MFFVRTVATQKQHSDGHTGHFEVGKSHESGFGFDTHDCVAIEIDFP